MSRHAIIVHDLPQARAALEAAAAHDLELELRSPPEAAAYMGAALFQEVIRGAAEAVPEARFRAVLDCGDAAGLALSALRHGVKVVRIQAPPDVLRRLAEVAEPLGASVEIPGGRDAEGVLDLQGVEDPTTTIDDWLNDKDSH